MVRRSLRSSASDFLAAISKRVSLMVFSSIWRSSSWFSISLFRESYSRELEMVSSWRWYFSMMLSCSEMDDGCSFCALQGYYKPVSCHLYPIRVEDYGEFQAVNYHQWDICRCAKDKGEPLYVYLKEPLIRRFGQEWYDELLEQIEIRKSDLQHNKR